jgi:glucosamine--fructose-6-phosphate aminotransferase (isomerizing)
MCGITAYLGPHEAVGNVLGPLRQLEHLGRHSAGIAVLGEQTIDIRREVGACDQLVARLQREPVSGRCAIAHTRGATVGAISIENAHPHSSTSHRVAMVHSGEVSNHAELRRELESLGTLFRSTSDSEVIPHLIDYYYQQGPQRGDARAAVRATLGRLQGGNAFAAVFVDHPGRIIAARNGSPLVLGRRSVAADAGSVHGSLPAGTPRSRALQWWLSSEVLPLRGLAHHVCTLADGQVADLTEDEVSVTDATGAEVRVAFRAMPIAVGLTVCHLLARRIRQAIRP